MPEPPVVLLARRLAHLRGFLVAGGGIGAQFALDRKAGP